jgi:hypothetical protein
MSSAQTFLVKVEEIGIDAISSKCGAPVRPIVEDIGLVKDNLGILLSGEFSFLASFVHNGHVSNSYLHLPLQH